MAGLIEPGQRVSRQADIETGEVVGELLGRPRAEDRDDAALARTQASATTEELSPSPSAMSATARAMVGEPARTALHQVARNLLQDWDDGVAVVADAAAQDARVLRVGTLTSIGRGLYPAITDQFAKRQPGWQVVLHTYEWGDQTAGLRAHVSDAAFVWLPIDAAEIETAVLATERRFVAISARHPLADRQSIEFFEIVNEPVAALPASAGSQRDFWLAVDARAGRPPRVAAEVSAADEKFEIVSSGAAITLLAEGNAGIYRREGIVCIPVLGVEPARLAIAWRRGDRRPAGLDFVQASRDAAGTQSGTA